MTRSPYAPPRADVRDRPPEPVLAKMPKEILLALVLLWVLLALGMADIFLEFRRSPEDERPFLMVVGGILLFLLGALNVCIARRRNWARWVFLLVVVAGFLALLPTLEEYTALPDYEIALDAVSYVLDLAVAALLFTKPGALWFRFRSKFAE